MRIKGYDFEVTEFVSADDANCSLERECQEGATIVKAEIICLDWTGHQTYVVKLNDDNTEYYL